MSAGKIAYRAFTKFDWFGFAGAESFSDGPPMIGNLTVDGAPGVVVIDATSVSVYWDETPGEDGDSKSLGVEFDAARATRVVAALGIETSTAELLAFGGRLEIL